MATVAWPSGDAFDPQAFRWILATPRAGWMAPFTGQRTSITHAGTERFQIVIDLAPCGLAAAGEREAYFARLARSGDLVQLWHMARPAPIGTMRGTPTLTSSASAGATSIAITTTAGATLAGGDVIGISGELIQAAYPGATADGAGAMTLPLARPLIAALTGGASVTWDAPKGEFQLEGVEPEFEYTRGVALPVTGIVFTEVA